VRLIYNTNFSKTKFKDIDVFKLWNKFDSVSVGASLDAEGVRAELMRKGTVWEETVSNRRRMMEVCPKVDFYISSTVGLINSLHITDFHRSWVEQGLIKPMDFNFNLLQYPDWQRMDVLPEEYKHKVKEKFQRQVKWLADKDPLTRASKGYEAAIDWIDRRDNTQLLPLFFKKTNLYDKIRNEKTIEVFPEWKELFDKYEKN